jgi:hypothetical protein
MSTRTVLASLFAFAVPLAVAACAATHEEPPAPPPPPIDPAAFSGPARPPAPAVDVSADLDASVVWVDATPASTDASPAQDAAVDGHVKLAPRH